MSVALTEYDREYVGAIRFDQAIDLFIQDMRREGRINSPSSERSYRGTLEKHAEDVGNRDPRTIGRDDVKRTLLRWSNPNSQRSKHSALNSFYDWAMVEGIRPTNPAKQVRRARKRETSVYRLTKQEMLAMWRVARTTREQRVIGLGFGAGLRNAELRGLKGKHFERAGWIHVSADIAKGGSQRFIPVFADLLAIVEDIRLTVGYEEYVIPAQRWRDPSHNKERVDLKLRHSSSQALRTLVGDVAKRAGIRAHIHPHLMRHAFGDHVARDRGLKVAQALMGHKDSKTTENYTGGTTLDELSAAMAGFSFLDEEDMGGYPPESLPANPLKATTGIEPVSTERRIAMRHDEKWRDRG